MIVTAWNPPTDELEKTYLSGYVTEGATSLPVQNSARFTVDKMIMIGRMGYEQTEIKKIDAPANSTTITLDVGSSAVTAFAHNTSDPVYALRYDQVLFYSANSITDTKTLLATLPVDVTNEDEQTLYEDLTGTGTTVYWTKYKHSVTGEETEFSDYIAADGVADESLGSIVERAARRLRDVGMSLITPELYLDFANEVNDDLTPQTERPYDFLHKKILLDRVHDQGYVDLPDDYEKFDYFIINNVFGGVGSVKPVVPIPYKQFIRGYAPQTGSDTTTRISLDPGNTRVLLKPTPRTDLAEAYELWYWTEFKKFKDFSDSIQTPTGSVYYYKFLAEGYSMKAERDPSFATLAAKYEQKYGNHIVMMQRMNRRDVGTPRDFMSSQRTGSVVNPPRRRYKL